jgi:hypothetical protein
MKTWNSKSSLSVAYIYKDEDIFEDNLKYTISSLSMIKACGPDVELVILKDSSGKNDDLDKNVNYLIDKIRQTDEGLSRSFPIRIIEDKFENNFSDWKNKLFDHCTKEWILNLDSDEHVRYEFLLRLFLEKYIIKDHDVMYIPRINVYNPPLTNRDKDTVIGWGWRMTNEFSARDVINFPDCQGRLYKNDPNIRWSGKVHESITNLTSDVKACTYIAKDINDCIIHIKSFEKQIQQNCLYNSI